MRDEVSLILELESGLMLDTLQVDLFFIIKISRWFEH